MKYEYSDEWNDTAQRKTHPSDILTTANTVWTGLGSNWVFFGDRLVTALAMFQPKM
jgi:hypothetical protein